MKGIFIVLFSASKLLAFELKCFESCYCCLVCYVDRYSVPQV